MEVVLILGLNSKFMSVLWLHYEVYKYRILGNCHGENIFIRRIRKRFNRFGDEPNKFFLAKTVS